MRKRSAAETRRSPMVGSVESNGGTAAGREKKDLLSSVAAAMPLLSAACGIPTFRALLPPLLPPPLLLPALPRLSPLPLPLQRSHLAPRAPLWRRAEPHASPQLALWSMPRPLR
mmetsp:Transcript_56484/g.112140  ORF Transcript_56484/g.112140 Transcript_56484/m.112140 type:complete len:114 (-) Transcript_56484:313-654(-)